MKWMIRTGAEQSKDEASQMMSIEHQEFSLVYGVSASSHI